MAISTSLALQSLLKSAVVRAGLDTSARRVAGLSPSAEALCAAAAASRARPAVLVLPGDPDVERAVADVRFFFTALEGLSGDEGERQVLPFPSLQVDPYRGLGPHFRVASARARALHGLAAGTTRVVVAAAAALLPRVPRPDRLLQASVTLRPGEDAPLHDLAAILADGGFTREDPVDEHGEFCLRGGILDVFPAGDTFPVRLEFIGDTIESIRRYDPSTQRSTTVIDQITIVPVRETFDLGAAEGLAATFFDYVPDGVRFLVSEPDEVGDRLTHAVDQISSSYVDVAEAGPPDAPDTDDEAGDAGDALMAPPDVLWLTPDAVRTELEAGVQLERLALDDPTAESGVDASIRIRCQPAVEFRGRIADWVADIRRARDQQETVLFVAATSGRAERTTELLAEYDVRATRVEDGADQFAAAVLVTTGELSRGFRLPDAELQIFAEADVFEEERRPSSRRRSVAKAFLSDLRDLKPGDLVVHVDHGIGVFVGLQHIGAGPTPEVSQEFMELRYAGEDKLFVPVERLDLVQKYTGATRPPLDKLGGTSWERAKTRVRKAMRDMAEELLKLYAARTATPGHAFSPDTHWQQEFEDAFEYELTPDQVTAVADIKQDMERPYPMDRLLCGDVGYGKTEVAMRAAFKAVMDGTQVAVLAPTTVLAFQHLKTLKERWAGFPVTIDMVSRFRSKAEQKRTLTDLTAGKVDIIVGTHRLLSKDVVFRDLGLLVVDEEQRFGVGHKERIKQLRRKVDVLTLSATPIPRTLNMSLMGIRDMSIIETPPKDRLSIQTNVVKFNSTVIARAVRDELARGGQVYFVHNRVESIFSIGDLVTRLVPEARIVVGHGQMGEEALERAMLDFVAGTYDVLLATTIIENGLDIPNVNTIIINRADRYGLAQLYQLRGRVGRSDRPAYAYLLIPPEDTLSPVAKRRLAAIKEFSDLGSGFRVAALDLEIRGAGTLLGGEQSGHIESVGFEMYTKLLEQAVGELKGEPVEDAARAAVNLGLDLRIDDEYVPEMNQRLALYRRIAAASDAGELDEILAEVEDRYGPPSASVLQLVDYGRIRLGADRLGVEAIDREGPTVLLRFRAQTPVDPHHLVALVSRRPELSLVPPVTLRMDLGDGDAPRPGPAGRPSWWTERATTGRVEPGFTREEILRPPRADPRGPTGVLTQVLDLLARLGAAH